MAGIRMRAMGVWLLAAAFAVGACGNGTDRESAPVAQEMPGMGAAEVPAELQGEGERFEAAWNADDASAVLEFFAEDATVNLDGEVLSGREQIFAGWLSQNVPATTSLQLTEETVTREGEGYRIAGRYMGSAMGPDGAVEISGSYEGLWEPVVGQWQIREATLRGDQPQSTDPM